MSEIEPSKGSDEVRTPHEVAVRTLALQAVVGVAMGADRPMVLQWLLDNGLWEALAPSEIGFLDTPEPSRQQIINASWLSERLIVLVWALRLVPNLPPADQQCNTSVFTTIIPPFADIEVCDFLAGAQLRPNSELLATAEELLDFHWHARDGKLNDKAPRKAANLGIIQERHHAINWITGYDGAAAWDEVTTDT